MSNRKIVLMIIVGLIIYAVPNIFYYYRLDTLSNETDKWGQYGDFIGGVLNPILTLINIGVFIFLTNKISRLDERINEQAIKTQKLITITQMRHESILKFEKDLELLEVKWEEDYNKVLSIHSALIDFRSSEGYLFGALIKGFPGSTYEPFLEIVAKIYEKEMKPTVNMKEEYDLKKTRFINELKQFILDELK